MHEIKTGKATIMLVEVPSDAISFSIVPNIKESQSIKYHIKGIVFAPTRYIELPSGNYTFLCTTTDITEDISAGIVDNYEGF